MASGTTLDDLFRVYAAAQARGQTTSAESLCRDCPELLDDLRRLIAQVTLAPPTVSPTQDALSRMPQGFPTLPEARADGGGPQSGAEPVPGYSLCRLLGKGGFGEVWEASAPGGFRVAFKFVPVAGRAAEVERRALEIIKNLRHPNLLTIFGTWQTEGWLIIGMELADQTLHDRLSEAARQGRAGLEYRSLLRYSVDTAKVIDYLNKPRHFLGGDKPVGIQHGDIKPQNILLLGEGVKVGDFGLARVLEQAGAPQGGGMTPHYAAPEVFEGRVSQWSDQYALAVTWCQLRGGRLPFTGTTAEVVAAHRHREPDLSMLPEAERPVVARALAKRPQQRWPSCRAFIKALAEAARAGAGKRPASTAAAPEMPRGGGASDLTTAIVDAPPGTGRPADRPVLPAGRRRLLRPFLVAGALIAALLVALPLLVGRRAAEGRKAAAPPAGVAKSDPRPPQGKAPSPPAPLLSQDLPLWMIRKACRVISANAAGPFHAVTVLMAEEQAVFLEDATAAARDATRFLAAGAAGPLHVAATPLLTEEDRLELRVSLDVEVPTACRLFGGGSVGILPATAVFLVEDENRMEEGGRHLYQPPPARADSLGCGAVAAFAGGPLQGWALLQLAEDPHILDPPAPGGAGAPLDEGKTPSSPDGSKRPVPPRVVALLLGVVFWCVVLFLRSRTMARRRKRREEGEAEHVSNDRGTDSRSPSMPPLRLRASGEEHLDAVWSVALSPDGHTACSGGLDGVLLLWDLRQGFAARRLASQEGVPTAVFFTGDGRALLSAGLDGTLRLWDSAGGEVRRLAGPSPILGAALSPGGRLVLAGCEDGSVRLWELGNGREVQQFSGHSGQVLAVAFSPDGRLVLSGGEDRTARVWDVESGRELHRLEGHAGPVRVVAFAPEGAVVVTGGEDGRLRLWDSRSGHEVGTLTGHADWVRAVAFSPDGNCLLSAGDDDTLCLWDVASRRLLWRFQTPQGSVLSIAFFPDGRRILTGSDDRSVRVWELTG